jgi:Cd2+/Zn2+-exporting ATPase
MNSKTNASGQSSEPQRIILAEDRRACAQCEAERAAREAVDFRTKYILALISGIALLAGIIIQVLVFPEAIAYVSFIVSILASGRWIIPNGLRSIVKLHLGISFLMTVASIGAVIIGAPSEGAAVMFLFNVAELIEEKAGDRVRDEIESLMDLEPQTVSVISNGEEACSSPDQVQVGQVFSVRPGELIGLDGRIVRGNSSVNQAPITGESLPVDKGIGDEVYAGTINVEGYLEVEVTRESHDSVLSRIVSLVSEARRSKSPTERFVSRFSHVYTPIVVLGSLLLGLITLILGASLEASVYRGLTLLVISCPCAFAISIPVSMVSSIVGSAREGVLIKGSDHLENLVKIRNVAFDKTGTLTSGELRLQSICLHNGATREDVLAAATALESMSEHPIASAIVQAGEEENVPKTEASDFVAVPGRGVKGRVGSETFLVGNRRLLTAERINLHEEGHVCGSGTMVYVIREQKHLGTVVLGDSIRTGTKEAIKLLRDQGIYTVMLTGDSSDAASKVSEELGVDECRAELLPEQKVEYVKSLVSKGPTMMVGDGINDTPALAASTVGVAMGVISSDAAIETADIALMEEDLRKIPHLLSRAKETLRIVRENVVLSISAKLIVGALAVIGLATLWMAILFGDMGLTLIVILNALRLARKTPS